MEGLALARRSPQDPAEGPKSLISADKECSHELGHHQGRLEAGQRQGAKSSSARSRSATATPRTRPSAKSVTPAAPGLHRKPPPLRPPPRDAGIRLRRTQPQAL